MSEESAARRMRVSVISPTEVGYEGEAESVVAPAFDGRLGILYGHAPMMVLLGTGDVVIRNGQHTETFTVARGFLQVVDNEISIMAEEVSGTNS
ncbi:MAG: ATP synthase F1 subunit epsilon [Gemmatimonadota bacterium]